MERCYQKSGFASGWCWARRYNPAKALGKERCITCRSMENAREISRANGKIREVLIYGNRHVKASIVAQMVKNPPAMQETGVWSLGREDPLEEGMAIHSSILAWKIPWTKEPGGPWSRKDSDMRVTKIFTLKACPCRASADGRVQASVDCSLESQNQSPSAWVTSQLIWSWYKCRYLFFFIIFPLSSYYKILSVGPCAIE